MVPSNPEYIITTRPILPPISKQPTIITSNPKVTLRPFHNEHLPALHELRTQIEVMQWTSTGNIDADLDKTRTWMDRFMEIEKDTKVNLENDEKSCGQPPNSPASFNFVIVYQEDSTQEADQAATTGIAIGAGGCHVLSPEPECGYMIRKEYWGRGIVTQVLKAFLVEYWNLDRQSVKIPWNPQLHDLAGSTQDGNEAVVRELLSAVIVAENIGSRRVLEKCGFKHHFNETIRERGQDVVLAHYTLARP